MVNTGERIERIIEEYIIPGKYFTINRARQYGKTTTLYLLEQSLKKRFLVLRLSFEYSDEYFASAGTFAEGLVLDISDRLSSLKMEDDIIRDWEKPVSGRFPMRDLGKRITELCKNCEKKVVLMIDEVDKSSDNQIFLSFLGMLWAKYLDQLAGTDTTFWSVILAGVYDIKNLKQKIHPGEESKYNSPWYVPIRKANRGRRPALPSPGGIPPSGWDMRRRRTIMAGSPWNIAADFTVDMGFSPEDIASMLRQYGTRG
ncbi:MAG: ATP-binding protein [Lachnospiraceae bacterium]|nr:ATP-binding protein [Lachnospiraceae bacterium]